MMMDVVHIGVMLDLSEDDAKMVIEDLAASIATHHLMSSVVGELTAKYDKKSILLGILLATTFEVNKQMASELNGHETKPVKKYDFGKG